MGRPRSGTTLMSSLLDAHPSLTILPIETEVFSLWYARCVDHVRNHENSVSFWTFFAAKSRFPKLEIDRSEIIPDSDDTDPLSILSCMLTKMGEYDACRHNKTRWGEKTPIHYKSLPLVFKAYPQAQVLMMLRDPRAILASLVKTPWNQETTEESARRWMEYIRIMQNWGSDPRVRIIRFEELVADTGRILQDVCRWLGEEYTPAMLDRSHLSHRLKTKKGWGLEHRRKALEPINAAGIGKWKEQLSPKQIKVTEHVCAPLMRQLGYEPVTSGLGLVRGAILDMKGSILDMKESLDQKKIFSKSLRKGAALFKKVILNPGRPVETSHSEK